MMTTGSVRGKCCVAAGVAAAPPAACEHPARRAAIGAEPVPRVPGEQAFGFAERTDDFGGQQALRRDQADIEEGDGLRRGRFVGPFDEARKQRRPLFAAKEHGFPHGPEFGRLVQGEIGVEAIGRAFHDRHAVGQHQRARFP